MPAWHMRAQELMKHNRILRGCVDGSYCAGLGKVAAPLDEPHVMQDHTGLLMAPIIH